MKTKHKTVASEKKKTWETFSKWVRLRDCIGTTGTKAFALCITCGKRYHISVLQAGHFIPGRHNSNLFSERGVHAQCYNCNINLKGNTLEYRRKIIELYGEGADLELEAEDRQLRKFTVSELEQMRADYNQKIKELENGM
jgi:hypothetical protein